MCRIWEVLKDVLPSICTIIVAIISGWFVIQSAKKSRREEQAKRLNEGLESFYYPFLLHAKKTTQLYAALKTLMQWENGENGCVSFLLEGNKFSGNAAIIFTQILDNDKQLNELIISHSNVVSNAKLSEELSELSAHYTILELAEKGNLKGDVDTLSKYSYPSKIVDSVENEITRIEARISKLSD